MSCIHKFDSLKGSVCAFFTRLKIDHKCDKRQRIIEKWMDLNTTCMHEKKYRCGSADRLYWALNANDVVIGIAASGTTPYVIGALKRCQEENITTACIVCNSNSPLSKVSDFPIEVVVGPEFVTGSTRMKSGTAQKLVLNMISTSVMIQLGKVKGNKMVDMQLSNNKLVDRGTNMIMKELGVDYDAANKLLEKYGSVRNAVDNYNG